MKYLILYLIFGGVLMASVADGLKEDCGKEMSVTEFALSSVAWPAMMAGAMMHRMKYGVDQGNICSK